jgi:hypothetical protein
MLDFGAGGWVLILSSLLVGLIVLWRALTMTTSDIPAVVGDGSDVATYGFDLSTVLLPRERIVAAGFPKNGVPDLMLPSLWGPAEVDSVAQRRRGKYLVSKDRVVGIEIEGHARAYPIRVMNWHEVVNDTLGGRAIAVTFSPLCDAVVAFDRRVRGSVVRFGVSGLLYNSNPLLYDDQPVDQDESLWLPLQARAVTGSAAERGDSLRVIPVAVIPWKQWRARFPETTVLAPDPAMVKEYRRDPYGSYSSSDLLRFPVDPLPPSGGPEQKAPMVIVRDGGQCLVYPIERIVSLAVPDGEWINRQLRFRAWAEPPTVWVERVDGGRPTDVRYAYWFAWFATHPEHAAMHLGDWDTRTVPR